MGNDPLVDLARRQKDVEQYSNLQELLDYKKPTQQTAAPPPAPVAPKEAEVDGWFTDFLKTTGSDYADILTKGVSFGIFKGEDLPFVGKMIENTRTPDERKAAWRKWAEFGAEMAIPAVALGPLTPGYWLTKLGVGTAKAVAPAAGKVVSGAIRAGTEGAAIAGTSAAVQETKQAMGTAGTPEDQAQGLPGRVGDVLLHTGFGAALGGVLGAGVGTLETVIASRAARRAATKTAADTATSKVSTLSLQEEALQTERAAVAEYDQNMIAWAKSLDTDVVRPAEKGALSVDAELTSGRATPPPAKAPIPAGPSSTERKPIAALGPAPEPPPISEPLSARTLVKNADRLEAEMFDRSPRVKEILGERVRELRTEAQARAAIEVAESTSDLLAKDVEAELAKRGTILGPAGKINVGLTTALARAAIGATIGAYSGNTPEERMNRALLGAGAAAFLSPALMRRAGSKLLDGLEKIIPVATVKAEPTATPITGARKLRVNAPAPEDRGEAIFTSDPASFPVADKSFKIHFEELEKNPDRMNEIVNKVDALYGTGKRPYKSDAELLQDAERLGPDILDIVLTRKPGEALNDTKIASAIGLMASMRQHTLGLADEFERSGKFTPEMLNFLGVFSAVRQSMKGASGESGASLRLWGSVARFLNDPAMQKAADLTEILGGPDGMKLVQGARLSDVRAMLADIKAAGQESWPHRAWRFLNNLGNGAGEVFVMDLVSGPITQSANVVGNTTMLGLNLGQRRLAEMFHVGKIPGVAEGETVATLMGNIQGGQNFLKLLAHNARRNVATMAGRGALGAAYGAYTGDTPENKLQSAATYGGLFALSGATKGWEGPSGKYVEGMRKSFTAENLLDPLGLNPNAWYGKAVDLLGEIIRIPGDNLFLADNLFRMMGFQGELNALTIRRAANSKLTGDAYNTFLKKISDTPAEETIAAAKQWGDRMVFADNFKSLMLQGFQQGISSHPLLRLAVPFFRTPIRLFQRGLDITPGLNFLDPEITKNIARQGAEGDLARGQVMLSVVVGLPILYAAYNGMVVGRHPKELAETYKAQNQPENSWKVGNTWVDLTRIDPIAFPVIALANYAKYGGQVDESHREDYLTAIALTMTGLLRDKTWAKNFGDVFETLTSDRGDKVNEYLEKWQASLVPGFLASQARLTDPYKKHLETATDRFFARVPGFNKDVPYEFNVIGEKIPLPAGFGPDTISPLFTWEQRQHPLLQAMLDNQVPGTRIPDVVKGRDPDAQPFTKPGDPRDGVKLTPGERALWAETAGKLYEKAGVKLVASESWRRMIAKATGPMSEAAKELRTAQADARREAFEIVLRKSPGLVDELDSLERRREIAFEGTRTPLGIQGVPR
jgi:hypothetical protein